MGSLTCIGVGWWMSVRWCSAAACSWVGTQPAVDLLDVVLAIDVLNTNGFSSSPGIVDPPEIINAVEVFDAEQLADVAVVFGEGNRFHGSGVISAGLVGVVVLNLPQILLAINGFNAESLGNVLLGSREVCWFGVGIGAQPAGLSWLLDLG